MPEVANRETLSEWYARFMQEHPTAATHKSKAARPPQATGVRGEGMCVRCGRGRISRGQSKTARYARLKGLCVRCYTGR